MGIHLFNPPEPCGNPHKGCGNCTGVPCKWRLRIHSYFDQNASQFVPEVDFLLERFGKTGCVWGLMDGPDFYPPQTAEHPMNKSWRLGFGQYIDVSTTQLASPHFVNDWVVWIAGRQTLDPHAVGGDSVYYRTYPAVPENHPNYNPTKEDRHFDCFGANRFYYWKGFNDRFSDGPGPAFGWPNEVTVIPWYGKDQQ